MKEIEKKLFANAIRILDSINVEYCIQHPDGQLIGVLKTEKKETRNPRKYAYGAVTRYLIPYVNLLRQGEVITVPVGEYDIDSIQSVACNMIKDLYGSGNYTTHRNADNLEILLLKGQE